MTANDRLIHAAIYARKSTAQEGKTEEELSTARQREHALAYGQAQGWTIRPEHVWIDEAVSGTKRGLKRRLQEGAGLYELMAAVKQKRVQKLVVMDIDRLIRDMAEGMQMMADLHEAGIEVWEYLHQRMVPMTTPTDRLMVCIRLFGGEQETYQISLRTKDGLRKKREAGYADGPAPYGFKNIPVIVNGTHQHSTREPVVSEVRVIKRLFTAYAGGQSPRKIAHGLNAARAVPPTPRQKGRTPGWTGPTVRAMLLRVSYRPLVGDSLWSRVQEQFTKPVLNNPMRQPPGRRDSHFLLTGLALCGRCGGPMIAVKWAYRCGRNHQGGRAACPNTLGMPRELVERAVLDAVEHDLTRPDVLEPMVEQIVRESLEEEEGEKTTGNFLSVHAKKKTGGPSDFGTGGRVLAKIDAELAHYAQAVASIGPQPSLLAEIQVREERKAHLLAELKKQPGKKPARPTKEKVARIKAELKDILEGWVETLSPETARATLQALLVSRLVFTPSKNGKVVTFEGEGSLSRVIEGRLSRMVQSRS